ncbi:MAG: hypothetical protein WEB52_02480 [Dehalococcoidia bacterium]
MAEQDPAGGDTAPDDLETARAEVGRLEAAAAQAADEAASLRSALAEAQAASETSSSEAEDLRAQIAETAQRERDAATRYRELAIRAEPALPAALIAGDTIAAVDASLVAARDVVGRVRSHIEAQASATRVPAGAPQRSSTDLSAMTPQQKIRYGLEQRAQG